MRILRTAGTAAAISVAGAGIAIGGIGLAAADDSVSAQQSTTQTDAPAADSDTTRREGRGHGDRAGGGEIAAGLAEALGLEESDVAAALEAVRDQHTSAPSKEDGTRTPPTEAEREAGRAALASALADELGVSEQKVTEALAAASTAQMAQARSGLADRLDAAVADGDLTAAEKQAVLKAFDAGVLGGGRLGSHGSNGDASVTG